MLRSFPYLRRECAQGNTDQQEGQKVQEVFLPRIYKNIKDQQRKRNNGQNLNCREHRIWEMWIQGEVIF